MSRSSYSDDFGEDFPGQLELYRANVERSMRSKAGQARLRELRDALLALPTKALEEDIFVSGTQDTPRVCALGAWALARCGGDVDAARRMVPTDGDDGDTYDALKPFGWPRLVVLDSVYINDETHFFYETVEGPHESPYGHRPVRYRREETAAERYVRVLGWVESQIREM